jgi:hypothetical protein
MDNNKLYRLEIEYDPDCEYNCMTCSKFKSKQLMTYYDGDYWNICKLRAEEEYKRYAMCNRCHRPVLKDEQIDRYKRTGEYYKTRKKCQVWLKEYNKHKYQCDKEGIVEMFAKLAIKNKDKLESIFECECGSKLLYRNK